MITISWKSWSWKWTISRILAEKLGYEIISIWSIKRKLAEDMGINILEFNKLWEEPGKAHEFDIKYEEYQKDLDPQGKIILESRLWALVQPHSFKIFLTIDDAEAAKRIFKDKRSTDVYESQEHLQKQIYERNKSDRERRINLYNFDFFDPNHYHYILSTEKNNPEELSEEIIAHYKERQKKSEK
jgi:CMP/dCMP kinase